jgi:UMF1 family MFS transporter
MTDKIKKRAIRAWTMYDWANSAFATTIMAAILPNYLLTYIKLNESLSSWGILVSIASLIAAVLSPILGAIADFRGSKKKFMAFFVGLGVISTALMFFADQPGEWLFIFILYILGTIGFAGSIVFYDALLPHIANEDEIDEVSSRGYAMGYIGGGLLLLINIAMIYLGPPLLNMEKTEGIKLMMRLSLFSVAIWWAIFSIPIFKNVREPDIKIEDGEAGQNYIVIGFKRFIKTFKNISNFKDLFLFLLAFFVYANGIGTIITMAVAYGTELGFGTTILIGTLLLVQFVAAPFSLLFGKLSKRFGLKKSIYIALVIYTLITLFGYFMTKKWHFIVLGLGVATVQGGSQALSRSLVGRLMPKSKSAEFYGFFSVSEKFNSVIGPALFALINYYSGNSRLAILSLIFFFIAGFILLTRVNIDRGVEVARAEDAKMIQVD